MTLRATGGTAEPAYDPVVADGLPVLGVATGHGACLPAPVAAEPRRPWLRSPGPGDPVTLRPPQGRRGRAARPRGCVRCGGPSPAPSPPCSWRSPSSAAVVRTGRAG